MKMTLAKHSKYLFKFGAYKRYNKGTLTNTWCFAFGKYRLIFF